MKIQLAFNPETHTTYVLYNHVMKEIPALKETVRDLTGDTWRLTCHNGDTTFDQLVNRFTYYNCGSQLGYYPQFFVPVP